MPACTMANIYLPQLLTTGENSIYEIMVRRSCIICHIFALYLWLILTLHSCARTGDGHQVFVRSSPQSLDIKLAGTGICLDVYAFRGAGSSVVLWACNGQKNQQFYFDDIQRLHPVYAPDLCLDYFLGSSKLGVWHCNGGANQQWHFHGGIID